MLIAIERIQAQLRSSAHQNYEAVALPPFTLFFNPDDASPYANYAIPDAPVGGDLRAPLTALRTTFAAHQRRPRFEFIAAYAPALPTALEAHGFRAEPPTYLMLCTSTTFRPAPAVAGLTVARLASARRSARRHLPTSRRPKRSSIGSGMPACRRSPPGSMGASWRRAVSPNRMRA
jgi:hypothetical protein